MSTTLEFDDLVAASNALEVHTLTTRRELDDLAEDWQTLGAANGGPIEQHEWAVTCALGLPEGDLRVVTVRRGEQLVAVAPMAIERINGVRRQTMLGVQCHKEPMDLLAADRAALERLASALAAMGRVCTFGRLPALSTSVDVLRTAFQQRALVSIRPQASYPYIPLDASWREPEQHLNSGRRSDLRRVRRRAEKLGTVAIDIVSPRPDELDALLDEAFEVEARSWKGREGTALACDPADLAFCRRYAHGACRQGSLRMSRLRINGRAAAVQIALVQGGSFWLLKIGYDAEFASCSPGMLLLGESIAYAARVGLASFEFLGQSEPWIEVWTPHKRSCVALRAYPYNLHGAAALAADASVKLAEKAAERLRQLGLRLRSAAKACAMPVLKRVARNYISGDTLDDARRVVSELAGQGLLATIGFWDTEQQTARTVADQYLSGLDALAGDSRGTYLSIKLPALRFNPDLLAEVAKGARSVDRRIHFDALSPEAAERTRAMIDDLLTATPGIDIGFTLPGRWKRSLDDARWAAQRGLYVRVVKGEWPDPLDPHRDLRAGYLEVIDQLAGRARRVGVATHDPELAAEAIRRLQASGTPCDLELLFGLPRRTSIRQARALNVDVRVYVPYGEAYMPYALSQVRRKPRILWWLLRDLLASARSQPIGSEA